MDGTLNTKHMLCDDFALTSEAQSQFHNVSMVDVHRCHSIEKLFQEKIF